MRKSIVSLGKSFESTMRTRRSIKRKMTVEETELHVKFKQELSQFMATYTDELTNKRTFFDSPWIKEGHYVAEDFKITENFGLVVIKDACLNIIYTALIEIPDLDPDENLTCESLYA